jgi:O-antigen/teichoic acid export membrane protein
VAQTAVRLACGFISIKVTAIYLGPAGLALTGQLGNFISLLQGGLGNAVNTAVTKLGAEAGERHPDRAAAVVGTALRLVTVMGAAATLVLLALHRPLSLWLLGDERLWPVIVVLALLIPGVLMGQLHNALFQSQRRFDLMALTTIGATVIGAIVFVGLSWAFGLWGGLIGTAVSYPLTFLVALRVGRRGAATRLLGYWRHAQAPMVRRIVAFYPMLLVHSAALPLALLLMRDTMIGTFGAAQAGMWQASVRLSDMYTMVILATLSMYSLPTLAAARSEVEFRAILVRLVGGCLAIASAAAIVLYLLRDLVVAVLFTHEFTPVRDLWPWQLVGDVFLLAGWPMRSALTARQRTFAYMAVEGGIAAGLVGATRLLVGPQGALAANMAHAIVWAVVFVCLLMLHIGTWRAKQEGAGS